MKIILFGGSGFLGKRLKSFLISKRFFVLSAGRSPQNDIVLDVLDTSLDLSNILSKYNFEVAINLIAITNILECEKFKDKCNQVNVMGTKIIAEFCNHNDIYLLNISTDMLYNKEFAVENDSNPINEYSISKFKAERYLDNLNASSLRLAFMGRSHNKKGFVDWLLNTINSKKEIDLWNNIFSTPLSIKDTLDAIFITINLKIRGVYNVGSKQQFSKYKFSIELLNKLKISYKNINVINYINSGEEVFRPLNMSMNSTKFINLTNWSQPDFSTTIDNIANEYLNENWKF